MYATVVAGNRTTRQRTAKFVQERSVQILSNLQIQIGETTSVRIILIFFRPSLVGGWNWINKPRQVYKVQLVLIELRFIRVNEVNDK